MAQQKRKGATNILEVQNAAKTMFANIRFQAVDRPIRSIMLTSSVPNEGKTTTTIFLAQAMATAGNRVLIVECDMRRRSLSAELSVYSKHGLYAVLTGEIPLNQAIIPTATPNMLFLDIEPSIPNPADVLASKRMLDLVEKLAHEFDYVVYDTPPVSTFVDAAVLARHLDGAILVVRPNTPKRSELQNAYDQLVKADARILGMCQTFAEGTGSEYYYAYYTKNGQRVLKDDSILEAATSPQVSTTPHVGANGYSGYAESTEASDARQLYSYPVSRVAAGAAPKQTQPTYNSAQGQGDGVNMPTARGRRK